MHAQLTALLAASEQSGGLSAAQAAAELAGVEVGGGGAVQLRRHADVEQAFERPLRFLAHADAGLEVVVDGGFELLLEELGGRGLVRHHVVDEQDAPAANAARHVEFGGAFVVFVLEKVHGCYLM
jgi:hypothetical protein